MKNLALLQSQMKQRIERRHHHEEATKDGIRVLGRPRQRTLAKSRRNACGGVRVCGKPENPRSLRADTPSGSEKHREHLCNRKDLISATTVVEQEFISNIPIGKRVPPEGEPWTYYLFAVLVTKHRAKHGEREIRTKYVHILTAPTQEAVDDLLLEFVTRPNVTCPGLIGV